MSGVEPSAGDSGPPNSSMASVTSSAHASDRAAPLRGPLVGRACRSCSCGRRPARSPASASIRRGWSPPAGASSTAIRCRGRCGGCRPGCSRRTTRTSRRGTRPTRSPPIRRRTCSRSRCRRTPPCACSAGPTASARRCRGGATSTCSWSTRSARAAGSCAGCSTPTWTSSTFRWPGLGAAVADADLVLLEASAIGPDGFVGVAGSRAAAAVAAHDETPVWLVSGVGRALPRRMWDALVSRLDDHG